MTTEAQIVDELANLNGQSVWRGFNNKDKLFVAMLSLIAGNTGGSAGGITQAQVKAAIESATNLDQLESLLSNLGTYVDGLEALNTTLNTYVDGIEALETAIRDRLNAVSFATDATVAAIGNKLPTAIALGSRPLAEAVAVALAKKTTLSRSVTAPAANLDLLSGTVDGWYDVSGFASVAIEISSNGGAGSVSFEQTNDPLSSVSPIQPIFEEESISGTAAVVGMSFSGLVIGKRSVRANLVANWLRVKINSGFTAGVKIDASFSQLPIARNNQSVGNINSIGLINNVAAVLDLRDSQIVGAATATAGNNILLASAGAGGYDTKVGPMYRSITVQILPAATTNAQILFEGSNDNTSWRPIQMVESEYAWTGLSYSSCNFNGSVPRIFEGAIKHRYIRFRLNNAASAAVTATTILSPIEYTYADRTFPSANFIQSAELNGSAGGTYVAAPAAPLQIYFCGATVASGGSTQLEDWWVGVNLPNGRKLGAFASTTTSPESGNIQPNTPLPCGVGNALSGYQNGGGGNMWTSAFYFIAP